jgi:glycerol-3-phosphate acyltransferase PlsY
MTPWALVIAFTVWFLVLYFSRYVALASICAAVAMPVAIAIMMTLQGKWNFVLLGFGILMGILVILRHRANIQRLLAGTENRFERKK